MTSPTLQRPSDTGPQDRCASRYLARHVLWNLSSLKRVRHCGRYSRSGDGVGVKITTGPAGERRAGFSNVQTCGSVWACPRCSAKIAAGRQADIEGALAEWHRRGGRVALVTLTMRHKRGQALAGLWGGVSDAWHRATSGAAWKAEQQLHGVPMARVVRSGARAGMTVIENRLRTIRVVEVTEGQNGWHVHIHALVFVAAGASVATVESIGAGMFGRWSAALVAGGFEAPSGRHGLDVRRLEGDPAAALGEYFTKAQYSASMETARGDLKDARGGNRTPFGILRGLVEVHSTGSLEGREGLPEVSHDEAKWAEWEKASKGRRQVAWTIGLRAELLTEEPELTDEELAEQDQGGEQLDRLVEPATFAEITNDRADWLVLVAFTRSDADGWALVDRYAAQAAIRESRAAAGYGRLSLPRPDYRRRPRV